MASRNYEVMFLLDSGKYATDPEQMTNEIMAIFERVGAEVKAHRPWQDGKLAYPVKKQYKGLHYLAYFNADSLAMEEFGRLCRLNTKILRFMLIEPPAQLFDVMVEGLLDPEKARSWADEAPAEQTERRPRRDRDRARDEEEAVEA